MNDAEIIPIGSGGRPGRGSRRSTTPSAAARSLAGSATRKRATQANPADSTDTAESPRTKGRRARTTRTGGTDTASTDASRAEGTGTATIGAGTGRADASGADATGAGRADASGMGTNPADADSAEARDADAGGGDSRGDAVRTGAVREDAAREDTAREDLDRTKGRGARAGVDASQFAALEKIVRDTLGPDVEHKVAELLAFLRRRLTGDYEIDEFGYDPELTAQVLLPLMRPMAEKWFRVDVRGAENIPDDGGALIVANHSGTLPIDGVVTHLVVHDHTGRPLRTLGADLVFKTPFVGELVRKGGGTLAGNDDAERLLGRGELVGVWPEGFKGIGKPFSERYKLQRFGRGGFVSAAMRTGVPIVPCSIVGAEEIYPLIGNIPSLARLLGVPYIPITPFFPLLGVLGMIPLPSKWLIEFGEPIRTDEFPEGAADDPMLVFNVTDQVRETIQQTLYSLLMQRRSVFF
jgi:1-acyl-sn-glycerol-3-phosphate acyltransferase